MFSISGSLMESVRVRRNDKDCKEFSDFIELWPCCQRTKGSCGLWVGLEKKDKVQKS
jgi:hypothetical protein